jgi:hypothetical protein
VGEHKRQGQSSLVVYQTNSLTIFCGKKKVQLKTASNLCILHRHTSHTHSAYQESINIKTRHLWERGDMKAISKEAPRKGFQFVDVLPELEGNVEKRNERKKLVRSNAAKYQWDRERSKGTKVRPSKERLKVTELDQDEEVVKILDDVDERKMVICGDATMEHIWDLIRPEDEKLGKLMRFSMFHSIYLWNDTEIYTQMQKSPSRISSLQSGQALHTPQP